MGDWGPIESDPAVFTSLVHKFGSRGLQVTEIYSLDEVESILSPQVHGLIFLFKWTGEKEQGSSGDPLPIVPEGLFFAKQVIRNACATQAILSVVLNADGIQLEQNLVDFKRFTAEMDPEMRGLAISNEESIRNAHNTYARHNPCDPEEKEREKGEAFHFVSYVPWREMVYELDGMLPGPIEIADINGKKWLDVVRPEIQRRIEAYQQKMGDEQPNESELRFNLMAIVTDPSLQAQAEIKFQRHLKQRCIIKLVSLGEDLVLDDEVDDDDAPAEVPLFEDLVLDDEVDDDD